MKKAAIVGFGVVAPNHAAGILKSENVVLSAICDKDFEKAVKATEIYGGQAFSNYDEMLDSGIDTVHICTPHYLHFEMAEKAVKKGIEVILEKPVTMLKEEFEKLLPYKDNISVMFQNRRNNSVVALKEFLETEDLGQLKEVEAKLLWHRDKTYYDSADWRGKLSTEGGGVLINQAIHTLDLCIYIGGKAKSVTARVENRTLKNVIEVEDTIDAELFFENGAKASFYATNGNETNEPIYIKYVFEKATFEYLDNALYRDGMQIIHDDSATFGKDYWGTGHEKVIKEYYEKDKKISIDNTENTMKAVFAMYESAKQGKEVLL